jgi:Cu/Ag efflux protein CusF
MLVLALALLSAAGSFRASQAQTTATAEGVDAVEVMKGTATVQKVNLGSRKVTLFLENGKKKTYKVDKSVQNLDQVKVGDTLIISYTEEIIPMVGKSNQAPGVIEGRGKESRPRELKP